jgi:hypothetical protein
MTGSGVPADDMSDLDATVLPAETVRADDALLDGALLDGPLFDGPLFDGPLLDGPLAADPGSPHPVADVLAALRAAPDPAELDREAAARAAFRMFQPDEAAPGPLARSQARSQPPRRQRPHRPRGGGRRPGRGLATALLGAAAAVVVALVLAFSLSGGGSGQPGARLPVTHAVPSGGEQKVEGGAVIPMTPARPAGSAAASRTAPAAPAAIPGCPHHGMHHRGCEAGPTGARPAR